MNLGQILLAAALAISSFQAISRIYKGKIFSQELLTFICSFFCVSSLFYLTYAYIVSDFSILNVFMNSNTMKPFIYKITGVYGNHEGSMLLFITLFSLYSIAFALVSKSGLKDEVLHYQSIIFSLMAGYTYFVSNPFESTPAFKGLGVPEQGRGLNPLLQDIGLAIHPPILYLGYAGLSIVFSYCCVVIKKNIAPQVWGGEIKNWVLWSWCFITLGVMLGSWWAYRELGWGGFWFWDPVENISLMPWLISCAMIHSLLYTRKFGGLNRASLLLGVLGFMSSLAGFFLVRSGILSSVHSFASDPTRGIIMLSIVFIVSAYAAVIFGKNFFKLKTGIVENYGVFSRQALVIANIVLLLTLTFTIKLGVIYPIILNIFDIAQISVGEPYFNRVFVPIAIFLGLVMIMTPFIKWQNEKVINIVKKSGLSFFVSLLLVTFLNYLSGGKFTLRPLIGLFVGLWLVLSLVEILIKRSLKKENISKGFFAMSVAHIGFGGLCIFISLLVSLESESQFTIKDGEKVKRSGYKITLKKSGITQEKNYFKQQAEFELVNNNEKVKLSPENRIYFPDMTKTFETDINYSLNEDLYLVMGESQREDDGIYEFPIRFYIKPFITWLWICAVVIAIGGGIAMLPKKK